MDYSRSGLRGKTALITGASRNIGRAITLAFAAAGADLVLNTRVNGEELEAVAVLADIADAAAVDSMVRLGPAELGAIDVLVCNAVLQPDAHIHLAVHRPGGAGVLLGLLALAGAPVVYLLAKRGRTSAAICSNWRSVSSLSQIGFMTK